MGNTIVRRTVFHGSWRKLKAIEDSGRDLSLVQQGILPVGSVKKDNILANVLTNTVDELKGNLNLKYFPL